MSMHAAPVIALLLTWVPAPASAQAIDQSFYVNARSAGDRSASYLGACSGFCPVYRPKLLLQAKYRVSGPRNET